ncbi:low molecular weight protein arginine phosphatase [Heliorestis convoluta]|uniref:Low molecular weight protein-tyrosine-phosphatase n=1 Tax=Heliorestis convoluta TaxID=356322 RepID=A0A5Q2N042_9FIRM|nr:low molecular weight protein arginine phosphatase [Heliorestis convoluta]QGG47093.1 low molecular weight protein-tyrosine-phosphatase [Heliorestis convoluta]
MDQTKRQLTLLFVCTGNTCRSPMAQTIARTLLEEQGRKGIQVLSAGTFAWKESPASLQARQVMLAQGLNLEDHRATTITEAQLQQADIILTMTQNQKELLLEMATDDTTRAKIFTLREFTGDSGDIADPFGQDETVYYQCYKELQASIANAINRIQM